MSLAPAAAVDRRLRVRTPFGLFEANASDLVSFPQGLPGFEDCHRFAILSPDVQGPLQCLHGIEGVRPTLLVINPWIALPTFRAVVSESDRVRLMAPDATPLLWLAVVTVSGGGTTVNLRAPIVVNPVHMIGYQILPNDSVYPLTFPLTLR